MHRTEAERLAWYIEKETGMHCAVFPIRYGFLDQYWVEACDGMNIDRKRYWFNSFEDFEGNRPVVKKPSLLQRVARSLLHLTSPGRIT